MGLYANDEYREVKARNRPMLPDWLTSPLIRKSFVSREDSCRLCLVLFVANLQAYNNAIPVLSDVSIFSIEEHTFFFVTISLKQWIILDMLSQFLISFELVEFVALKKQDFNCSLMPMDEATGEVLSLIHI